MDLTVFFIVVYCRSIMSIIELNNDNFVLMHRRKTIHLSMEWLLLEIHAIRRTDPALPEAHWRSSFPVRDLWKHVRKIRPSVAAHEETSNMNRNFIISKQRLRLNHPRIKPYPSPRDSFFKCIFLNVNLRQQRDNISRCNKIVHRLAKGSSLGTHISDQWRILDFIKGATFLWPLMLTTGGGANQVSIFFTISKKIRSKRGHGPMPPKHATVSHYIQPGSEEPLFQDCNGTRLHAVISEVDELNPFNC